MKRLIMIAAALRFNQVPRVTVLRVCRRRSEVWRGFAGAVPKAHRYRRASPAVSFRVYLATMRDVDQRPWRMTAAAGAPLRVIRWAMPTRAECPE